MKNTKTIKPLKITLEDVGRFFFEYVIMRGTDLVGIYPTAAKCPTAIRKELASQASRAGKVTPVEAKFFIDFAM